MAAETVVEHVLDRVERHAVGSVCDKVTRPPVLAGVERCDLSVEAVGLPLEVGEVVLRGRQLEVGMASLSARPPPALQRGDVSPLLLESFLGLGSRSRERGEVARSIWRRLIEDRLDAPTFGDQVGGAPGLQRDRGDALESELLVAAAFEAGGEDVERVVRADRRRVWAVFESEVELGCGRPGHVDAVLLAAA